MDLGSAVLSAELALELLDAARDRVVLCPAPLVEGLVAAPVAAAGGAGREEVAVEAVAGLAGKQTQLGTLAASTGLAGSPATGPTARFTVANPHGLHARPAARLVTLVRTFDADVRIRNLSTGSPWTPACRGTARRPGGQGGGTRDQPAPCRRAGHAGARPPGRRGGPRSPVRLI